VTTVGRIVEIQDDERHLARYRGFLTVSAADEEIGRVALDDVAALISTGRGVTCSGSLLVALAQRGVPVVFCAANYLPEACLWPVDGHYDQAGRMAEQAAASKPLRKRLWAQIVSAKIRAQAETLRAVGAPHGAVAAMARRVRSGDPENVEAQAARRYWKLLFGSDFRRRRGEGGANGMLNYIYTVLRAGAARAVMTAGLHPSFGLAHRQRGNSFALADDLMEPFRPVADLLVHELAASGRSRVDKETKPELAKILTVDLRDAEKDRPVAACLRELAFSLTRCLAGETRTLALPKRSLPPPA